MAVSSPESDILATHNHTRVFPLYDNLANRINAKITQDKLSLNEEYLANLHKILNSLDEEQMTQITLLLIHYYLLNHPQQQPFIAQNLKHGRSGSSSSNLPFGIKSGPDGKGFSFELDQMDAPLQVLLGTFCGL